MNGLDKEIDAKTEASRVRLTMRAVASEAVAALWVAAALAALAFFW